MSTEEECSICFRENVVLVSLLPCGHRFCRECVRRAACGTGMRCAMCRGTIVGVYPAEEQQNARVLRVGHGRYAGITVKDDPRGGVQVVRLVPGDEAEAVLRIGDVLASVNGLPAIHHRDVIRLIDAATIANVPVQVTLRARGVMGGAERCMRRMARTFHRMEGEWVRGHTRSLP